MPKRTICGVYRKLKTPVQLTVAHVHCRCESEDNHAGPHCCGICDGRWDDVPPDEPSLDELARAREPDFDGHMQD